MVVLAATGTTILAFHDNGGSHSPARRPLPSAPPSVAAPPPPSTIPVAPAGYLQSPGALAVAPDGSLVIADGNRIVRRTVDGTFTVLAPIGARSLAVAPDGTIFAADRNRVVSVARDGDVVTVASLPGAYSIAIAPDGTLYAVDDEGIVAVGPDGPPRLVMGAHRFVDVQGRPTAFWPSMVTVGADRNLYLADGGVKLFAEFAPDGTLLDAFAPIGVYVTPGSGLTTAPDGTIVLAEWSGRIERLDDGVLSTILDGYRANGVAVATDGTIYFSGGNNGWTPTGLWAVATDGTLTRLDPP